VGVGRWQRRSEVGVPPLPTTRKRLEWNGMAWRAGWLAQEAELSTK
jgi:hypothetical protein